MAVHGITLSSRLRSQVTPKLSITNHGLNKSLKKMTPVTGHAKSIGDPLITYDCEYNQLYRRVNKAFTPHNALFLHFGHSTVVKLG